MIFDMTARDRLKVELETDIYAGSAIGGAFTEENNVLLLYAEITPRKKKSPHWEAVVKS